MNHSKNKIKCKQCVLLKKELNDLVRRHIELEDYRTDNIIDWIRNGSKPAVLSFTAGNERQIAYAIEDLWIGKSDRLRVKRPKKFIKKKS